MCRLLYQLGLEDACHGAEKKDCSEDYFNDSEKNSKACFLVNVTSIIIICR